MQLEDAITTGVNTFPEGSTAEVTDSTANLTVNTAYDGVTTTTLLSGTDSLAAAESGEVTVEVTFTPDGNHPYQNQATGSGTGASSGQPETDLSDNPETDADPSDPTEADPPISSGIELTKTLGELVDNGDGTFMAPYTLVVTNAGNEPLENLSVEDSLATYPLGVTAVVTSASGNWTVNPDYTGILDIELLASDNTLAVGATETLELEVTFTPDGQQPYANTATTQGQGVYEGGNVTDEDSSEDADPELLPSLGLVKTLDSLVDNSDGSFTASFTLQVTNTGNELMNDVQVVDAIHEAPNNYPTGAVAQVTGSSAGFAINTGYDGVTDTNLLSGSDSMAVGAVETVSLVVTFVPESNLDYLNQGQVTGAGNASSDPVSVLSSTTEDVVDNRPTVADPLLVPSLALEKSLNSAVEDGSGGYIVTYLLSVSNVGNEILNNVQITDNLSAYPEDSSVIVTVQSENATLNTLYDGFTETKLLADGVQLGIAESIVVEIQISFASADATYANTAYSTARGLYTNTLTTGEDSAEDLTISGSSNTSTCVDGECFEATTSACLDGMDNDEDGLIDCADPDCVALLIDDSCSEDSELLCIDGVDNDGDGLIDCSDPDCVALDLESCEASQCEDFTDDDSDGDVFDLTQEYSYGAHPNKGDHFVYLDGVATSYAAGLVVQENLDGLTTTIGATVEATITVPVTISDATYILEFIENLGDAVTNGDHSEWTTLSDPTITDNGDGTETHKWEDLQQLTGSVSQGFVRLRSVTPCDTEGSYSLIQGWEVVVHDGRLQTEGVTLLNQPLYTGVITSNDTSIITLDQTLSGDDASQKVSDEPCYIEITDGDYEGYRFDLEEGLSDGVKVDLASDNNTVSTLPDLSGSHFIIRAHHVLGELYKTDEYDQGFTQSAADQIQIYSRDGYDIYYNNFLGVWTDVEDRTSGMKVVIPPGKGVFIQHLLETDQNVELRVGAVRYNKFIRPLYRDLTGLNHIALGYPESQSSAELSMSTDNLFTGSFTQSASDQIQIWAGDYAGNINSKGYTIYALSLTDYWYNIDNQGVDYSNEELFIHNRAAFIEVQDDVLNWTHEMPYSNEGWDTYE